MKAIFVMAALGVVGSLVTAQTSGSYQLTRKVRPGQTFKFDVEMAFMQDGAEIKLVGTATESVLKVEDGNFVFERKLSDIKAIISDRTIDVPEDQAQNMKFADIARSIVTSQVTGEVTNIQKNRTRSVDYAFAAATNAIVGYDYVKIGDTWTRAIQQGGAPKMDMQVRADKLDVVQGENTVAVALSGKQSTTKNGVDASGTVWISTTTGVAVKTDVMVKNLPLGERGERVDVRMVQTLRKQ